MPLACTPIIVRQHGKARKATLVSLLILAGVAVAFWFTHESDNQTLEYRPPEPQVNVRQAVSDQQLQAATPNLTDHKNYVGSQACAKCHQQEHQSWHSSYHRTMTQIASPETIKADFDGREMKLGNTTYKIYRKGDEFWVRSHDPAWEVRQLPTEIRNHPNPQMADKRIVMITGSHKMHMFWMSWKHSDEQPELSELDNNSLWLFPWVYMIEQKKWIPYEDSFIADPQFGRPPTVWNQSCIACHAVAGQPQYQPSDDPFSIEFHSNIADFGISCEACHGPGKPHIEKHQDLLDANINVELSGIADNTIINPDRLDKERQAQVCGQCHSLFESSHPESFLADGLDYQPGNDLLANRKMIHHKDTDPSLLYYNMFWNDGTMRIGGREYPGLVQSKCYTHGEMTCLSCHSMHSMQEPSKQLGLNMNTDQACIQCHKEPEYTTDLIRHTHHQVDSEGSRCLNCHMPHTSYALMRGIRSHRIDSPKIRSSQKNEKPNACNLCHLDKTLQWTADNLTQWYGHPTIKLNDQNQNVAASLVWLLQGNAVQRTLAAWHMSWQPTFETSATDWRVPFMIQLLNDNYAATRYVTSQSLMKLPEYQIVQEGEPFYEFISPAPERVAIQQALMDSWNRKMGELPISNPQLLFLPNANSELDSDTLLRLIQNRDNTSILMSE
ncbi:MAG: hypothetical protein CMJ82_06670 [Planctomycetaceae bacterium]|nr:hypothetical protein [Planctomycetaceae bacterium]